MMFKGTATIGTRKHRTGPAADRPARPGEGGDQSRGGGAARGAPARADRGTRTTRPGGRPRHQQLLDRFDALLDEQSELIIKEDFSRPLLGAGCIGDERRDELRLHHLLRQRAGQQARALVLDGGRPAAEPGVSRVLLRARCRARRAADADRQHPDRENTRSSSTRCSGSRRPTVGQSWGGRATSKGLPEKRLWRFFETYYAPNNLTAALVGDFDPAEAKALAETLLRPAPARRAAAGAAADPRDAAALREADARLRRHQPTGRGPLPLGA